MPPKRYQVQQVHQDDEASSQPDWHDARGRSLWLRSLQAKLLAAKAGQASVSADAVAQAEAATAELTEAMSAMGPTVALRPGEWALRSAYILYLLGREQRASSAPRVQALEHAVEIHEQAGREGTSMDAAAHARHASLMLQWHQAYSGVPVWTQFLEVLDASCDFDLYEPQRRAVQTPGSEGTIDILQTMTGLVGGPLLQKTLSGAWAYINTSLPDIPTREEVMNLTQGGDAAEEAIVNRYDACLGEEAVRRSLWSGYSLIAHDPVNSQAIFLMYGAFEKAYFDRGPSPEQHDRLLRLYRARAAVAHDQHGHTMSLMSEFVTKHCDPERYEGLMAAAASAGAAALAHANLVRVHEAALHSVFATAARPFGAVEPSDEARAQLIQYLVSLTDRSKPNVAQVTILYRRILALLGLPPTLTRAEQSPPTPEYELARHAKSPETKAAAGAELDAAFAAAEGVWEDYLTFAAIYGDASSASEQLEEGRQAVRVISDSGTLWALLMRTQTRLWQPPEAVEQTFQHVLDIGQVVKRGVVSFANLLLGRCVAEKQMTLADLAQEQGVPLSEVQLDGAMDAFVRVLEVAQRALDLSKTNPSRGRSSGKAGADPELRLERFFSSWCECFGPDTALLANDMWDEVANAQRTSSRAQVVAAEYFTRTGQVGKARHLYKRGSRLVTEDKVRLLDAWVGFEQVYGTVSDVEYALARSKRETQKAWEEYYATYQAQTQAYVPDHEPQSAPSETTAPEVSMVSEVDHTLPSAIPTGGKRKADDAALDVPSAVASTAIVSSSVSGGETARPKPKPKVADPATTPDRENCSVVVSSSVVEPAPSANEISSLFQGCGTVSDLIEPRALPSGHWAGLVVFSDRSSIPTALTRDQKRISVAGGMTDAVHVTVSRDCTLYVTNFPDTYTDASVKAMFSEFGDVLDVRWPSRRFSSSRRFCYVEMANASSAGRSLSLNGRQLTELNRLTVALSDPERRKVRSDANASEREVYVAGLPHHMSVDDVRALFAQQADLLAIRVPHPGIAFADFRTALDAHKAQAQLDGMDIQGRPLKATMADPSKKHQQVPRGGQGFRSRAVHVADLPSDTQEALVQQTFEQLLGLSTVRKVEYTPGSSTAIVELASAQLAGQALLAPRVVYGETEVTLSSLEQGRVGGGRGSTKSARSSVPKTAIAFAPRTTRRAAAPKNGPLVPAQGPAEGESMDVDPPTAPASAATDSASRKTNQDKFRALLG